MFPFLKKLLFEENSEQASNYVQKVETPFERESFYGVDFIWYAVDATGSIAQFTSGYTPIPKKVFSDWVIYENINSYFSNLPSITKSILSPKYEKYSNSSINGFAFTLKKPRKGLFIFEEYSEVYKDQLYGTYESKYELYSIPKRELKVQELSLQIQEYLSSFVLQLRFKETMIIDVRDYFDCDK